MTARFFFFFFFFFFLKKKKKGEKKKKKMATGMTTIAPSASHDEEDAADREEERYRVQLYEASLLLLAVYDVQGVEERLNAALALQSETPRPTRNERRNSGGPFEATRVSSLAVC